MDSLLARIITKIFLTLRSHVQRHSKLYAAIASAGPFLAGPLLIVVSPVNPDSLFALKRYMAVLILFCAWEMLLHTTIRIRLSKEQEHHDAEQRAHQQAQRKSKRKNRSQQSEITAPGRWDWALSTADKVRLGASALIIIFTLDLFRGYFNDIVFALVLGIFTCGASSRFLQRRSPQRPSQYLRSLAPQLLYGSGLGYLTCLAMRGDFFLQPLVLTSAIASLAMVPALLQHVINQDAAGTISVTARAYLLRSLALLLSFAPVAVGLLVYANQLSLSYLAVFLCFSTGYPLLQKLSKTSPDNPASPDLQWLGSLTAILFLLTLGVLRVTQGAP